MAKTIEYSVAVHWCLLPRGREQMFKDLLAGDRYLEIMVGPVPWYRLLPKVCKCRWMITRKKADEFVMQGNAKPIWRMRPPLELDYSAIWVPQERQVPRVDLVSKTDIERAYVNCLKSSMEYIEEIHKMYENNRKQLIVPFREDPSEGRILFPFASEERTPGGFKNGRH